LSLIYLIALAVIGVALLIVCIYTLVSTLVGWNCKYASSITRNTVDIPKAGRYSIIIGRDRFWLFKGNGDSSDVFPRINFSIQRIDTGEEIKYRARLNPFLNTTGFSRIYVFVGYFNAPSSGRYLITSLPESHFTRNEEILIRKHFSFFKMLFSILGIAIGAFLFFGSLIWSISNTQANQTRSPINSINITLDETEVKNIILENSKKYSLWVDCDFEYYEGFAPLINISIKKEGIEIIGKDYNPLKTSVKMYSSTFTINDKVKTRFRGRLDRINLESGEYEININKTFDDKLIQLNKCVFYIK